MLNSAGMDAQFERSRCAISRGILNIAKWVRNALDLNDGDELLFEVVDNKIIFTKAEG